MEEWKMLLIRMVQHKQESKTLPSDSQVWGLFEIKGELSILNKMCKGPPFLNGTFGCVFCPAAVILYRRVRGFPPPLLFKYIS